MISINKKSIFQFYSSIHRRFFKNVIYIFENRMILHAIFVFSDNELFLRYGIMPIKHKLFKRGDGMLSYFKNKKSRLVFIGANILFIVFLVGSGQAHKNEIYSAVIDRVNGEIATVLMAEINTQCILTTSELPQISSRYEQIWLNVEYNQQTEMCKFIAIDFKKTEQQKGHVLELQKRLRRTIN